MGKGTAGVRRVKAIREAMELSSLKGFKKHADVVLRDMVSDHGNDGLGLDLHGLFQP